MRPESEVSKPLSSPCPAAAAVGRYDEKPLIACDKEYEGAKLMQYNANNALVQTIQKNRSVLGEAQEPTVDC